MHRNISTLRGALLVAGTSIGGGMLALPVLTSLGGFVPSLIIYWACWMFMASTGLLFLEVSLWMKKESNIISMAKYTLGLPGQIIAWILYLFLFYCLTLAYIVGCGNLLVEFTGNAIPDWLGPFIFLILFAPLVYAGSSVVSRLNIFLMLGLGASFLGFVLLGWSHVDINLLKHQDWSKSILALPIAFTSFAYQGIIPTLMTDLQQDANKARKAILFGSALPFFAYVIWQWLILGIVPVNGPHGLAEALANGENAVYPLKFFLGTSSVYIVGQYFAFFALVTSFFGVTLGLVDFLADGLKIEKNPLGKLQLCTLVFIPPLIIAFMYPHIFLQALDYAGGFGCALLLGLLPVLMVWVGRYKLGLKNHCILPGGRPALLLLALFVFFELACELLF